MKRWQICVLALATCVTLSACDGPGTPKVESPMGAPIAKPTPPAPNPYDQLADELRDIPGVTKVSYWHGMVEVELLENSEDGSGPLEDSLNVEKQIGQALREATYVPAGSLTEVTLNVSGKTIDHLGHDDVETMFRYYFPAADLAAADFGRLNSARQADLADNFIVEGVAGADVVRAFCADPETDPTPLLLCRKFRA